jgi:hypothetical protein
MLTMLAIAASLTLPKDKQADFRLTSVAQGYSMHVFKVSAELTPLT